MTHKILVIPSWYPTIDSPAIGGFCKEQTELVSDQFDIRILYPGLRVISKKKTLERIFKPNVSKISNTLLGEIAGVELETMVSSFLSFKQQINFHIAQCRSYLQSMIIKGWKPDIIHAHGTMYGGVISAALGKSFNLPVIITEHHSLLVANFDEIRWAIYKNALESCDLVITVSNELKKMILMNGVKCNTIVLGNLIDEELFCMQENKNETNLFKILFIAVPAFTKDIPTFIKALSLVKKSGFNNFEATLIIPDLKADLTKQEIINLCIENEVLENCIFLGNTAHDQIPEIINACDVLISTSITETFGLSVAEAIMCGKPVIATRSGGVEDFVNSKNGILVNIGDFTEISQAIITFIKGDKKIDPKITRKAMITTFGKKAFKDRICNIYDNHLIK
jgi:glycosyltransferase involved in cell wall biosynthesis